MIIPNHSAHCSERTGGVGGGGETETLHGEEGYTQPHNQPPLAMRNCGISALTHPIPVLHHGFYISDGLASVESILHVEAS